MVPVQPTDPVAKQKYRPKPWWFYKQKRKQARKLQENQNLEFQIAPNAPKRSNLLLNVAKKDAQLYRDDADIDVVDVTGNADLRCNKWHEMNFDKRLFVNIKRCGFLWPRKVQEAVIPYILEGYDIKCQSETGTGKTAAYLIPIIDNLIKEKATKGLSDEGPICVILAPTREIVEQIFQDAQKLVYRTGITVAKAYGEIRMKDNLKQLTKGCNILCACIGRLMNLMEHDHEEWDDLLMLDMKYLVIDEADYFLTGPETQDIVKFLDHKRLPPVNQRQNLYFSPTLRTKRLELISDKYSNIKKMALITSSLECNRRIKFFVENIRFADDKPESLKKCVAKIIAENEGKCPRIMVFTNRKKTADKVADDLKYANFPAVVIHSDFSQHRRDKTMTEFRKQSSKCRILVSVNVVGRGIDVEEMDYVINYDIPDSHDSKYRFIQRCGRTGRTHSGTAYTFYVEANDKDMASDIAKVLQNAQQIPKFLEGHILTTKIEKSMEQLSVN